MRLIGWTWLVLVASLGVAHAGRTTIVVMAEPTRAGELDSALQVTLAGRDVTIASAAAPEGALRLARAAVAQRTAVSLGADAALWIDHEDASIEVCAVSPDGGYFRHAPIASESPRAFAEIAASLLDELFAPPEGVNVHVDVHIDGMLASATAPLASAPPVSAIASLPPASPGVTASLPMQRRSASRVQLEIGPALTTLAVVPLGAGLEGELTLAVDTSLRLGIGAHLLVPLSSSNESYQTQSMYYDVFGELRVVGGGYHHVALALIGGYMPHATPGQSFPWVEGGGSSQNACEFGARLSYTWDLANSGVSFSLVPFIRYVFANTAWDLGSTAGAGGLVTLRWELPL
jgi:hypothetical protein